MRSFLVVLFASVVYARPDIGLQLRKPKQYQLNSGSGRQYLAPFELHPGFSNTGHLSVASSGFNSGLLAPATATGGHETHYHHESHHQHSLEPLITKQFYIHSAPEDNSNYGKTKHFQLGRAQKNYRVVFIRTPFSGDSNPRLSAEYAPSEDKTVIYVLTQKEHELDINDIATPAPTTPSKPEVFFIKYKTPEEAAHAQQQIQAQYDALGGSSQVTDEGTAPLTSVVGSLGEEPKKPSTLHNYHHESASISNSFAPPITASTAYLPPNRF